MEHHNVAIVGAGPAGITAAIQLKRSGITPLLFERREPGGLLLNANLVENYPGFPDGVDGIELVRAMILHLERVGMTITRSEVRSVRHGRETFLLETARGVITARSVIVATGTRGIVPDNISIPPSLFGKRIFCELRDCPAGVGNRIAIIGGGDCAFDYALNLAGRGCRVMILHRGSRPGALSLLVDRAEEHPLIEYTSNVIVKHIEGDDSEICLHLDGGWERALEADFILLAVGRVPEDSILSAELRDTIGREGGVERLYLAGDVHRGFMRQVGIAVGDGLTAAMDVSRRWKEKGEAGLSDKRFFIGEEVPGPVMGGSEDRVEKRNP